VEEISLPNFRNQVTVV